MTFGSFISCLSAALIAGSLAFTPIFAAVHAAEDHRKVIVVSFGLFGGQSVFPRTDLGPTRLSYDSTARQVAMRPSKRSLQRCKRRQRR